MYVTFSQNVKRSVYSLHTNSPVAVWENLLEADACIATVATNVDIPDTEYTV